MEEKFGDCDEGIAQYLSELPQGTSTQRRHGNEISVIKWNDKNLKLGFNSWVKLKGSVRISLIM
jgi:hypothetical protein